MTRNDAHFRLRLPAEVHEQIAEDAKKAGRSLNAEILAKLRERMPNDDEIAKIIDAEDRTRRATEQLLEAQNNMLRFVNSLVLEASDLISSEQAADVATVARWKRHRAVAERYLDHVRERDLSERNQGSYALETGVQMPESGVDIDSASSIVSREDDFIDPEQPSPTPTPPRTRRKPKAG